MIPQSLAANPRLDRWVSFRPDRTVLIGFGKVEYGQGTATALAQIGADELDVAMADVRIEEPATASAPDEGMTVGSMSVESSGPSVRAACAEVRAIFLAHAAEVLSCGRDELSIRDGSILREGQPSGHDYWSLTSDVDLNRPPTDDVKLKAPGAYRIVGKSQPRLDLPAKVFGGAFIYDIMPEGVVHARVLRQPGPRAKLLRLDEAAIRKAGGADVEIFRDGDFVAFLSPSESAVSAALAAAEQSTQWENARVLTREMSEAAHLKTLPGTEINNGPEPGEPSNRRKVTAAYSKPYLAHGSMGPSCGVAEYKNGALKIWTHAQGVFPLRQLVSRGLGLSIEAISVIHAQGPGNYGHNGADDAAFDAAIIAVKSPGRPIRVQWRREDEFGHAPLGTAMQIELTAELDASGRIADYSAEIWSGSHVNRGRALAESALPRTDAPPPPRPAAAAPTAARAPVFSGGSLNAIPSYDLPAVRVKEHLIVQTPVRTSALRGLGGPPNEYAGECFVDELAELAGEDPLAYRLAMMTSDARARAALERLGQMCNWSARGPAGTGKGLGLAYTRHRNRGARVAAAVAVEVDTEVRLTHMWCTADCGLIINPDGARNQIEGGMIMAASWALKEQIHLGGSGIETSSWDDYPILRFDEIPHVDIELMASEERPMGIGEISSGPALAAIGNAVAHAIGARIRTLPFTRERIASALLAQ